MYPYERGSVSTMVCHLFVVRVPERSAVCSQALGAVSSIVNGDSDTLNYLMIIVAMSWL